MMEKGISFSAESHTGKMLEAWWQGLQDRPGLKGDKATRAVLRRCATITDVSLSDAYQRFYRYMLATNAWRPDAHPCQNDKLAAIAGLLSQIERLDKVPLPVRMSATDKDKKDKPPVSEAASAEDISRTKNTKPLVSELRFRALLKMDSTEELFFALRRVLPLIDYQADVKQLAHDIFYWNDETKKLWAYSYVWPAKSTP